MERKYSTEPPTTSTVLTLGRDEDGREEGASINNIPNYYKNEYEFQYRLCSIFENPPFKHTCYLDKKREGYEVKTVEDTLGVGDIYVTTTGNRDVIRIEHMNKMKDQAIVCNIGHFDNEIQVDKLNNYPGIKKINIKPQVDKYIFPDGREIFMLAEGRLVNLGCATGHPSFVMSNSFSNQTLAQIDLWKNRDVYEKKVYMLSKILDEEVARLHLEKIGVKLTRLTKEQADYIGVKIEGPYKPEHYKY